MTQLERDIFDDFILRFFIQDSESIFHENPFLRKMILKRYREAFPENEVSTSQLYYKKNLYDHNYRTVNYIEG